MEPAETIFLWAPVNLLFQALEMSVFWLPRSDWHGGFVQASGFLTSTPFLTPSATCLSPPGHGQASHLLLLTFAVHPARGVGGRIGT